MKPICRSLSLGIVVALFAMSASSATAQEADKSVDLLLDVSCADYLQALSIAQPDAKATADQKEAAERAQDDIVSAMLWIHGYNSGRQPTGTAFAPLTRQWMANQVVRVAGACKAHSPDGKMTLADAATRP